MKLRLSQVRLLVASGAISGLVLIPASAQQSTPAADSQTAAPAVSSSSAATTQTPAAAATTATSTASDTATVKYPYGVEDVVKLSRAHVNEEVITTYIQNSGTIYNIAATDIVNLKNEGVSDNIINQMMDQRKRAAEASAQTQTPTQVALTDPSVAAITAAAVAPTYSQAPYVDTTAYGPPAAEVVEQAPSTVYVIPDPAVSFAYYGGGPYYRPYYRGYYPYRSGFVTIHGGYGSYGGHRGFRGHR